jgi:hypothetical protein
VDGGGPITGSPTSETVVLWGWAMGSARWARALAVIGPIRAWSLAFVRVISVISMTYHSTLFALPVAAALLIVSCGGSSDESAGESAAEESAEESAEEGSGSDQADASDEDSGAAAGSNEEAEANSGLDIDPDEL